MTPLERTTTIAAPDIPEPPGPSLPQVMDPGRSRTRRVAFRVLAVLTSVWVLALGVFGLTEVVLMWLPADTLAGLLGEDAPAHLEAHRSHLMSIGVGAWALLLAVAVQVRRPHRREAAMVWAVTVAVAGTVVFGVSGRGAEWLIADVSVLVLVLALAVLHPRARDLARRPDRESAMATLAVLAAVPWLIFAAVQVLHQWRSVPGDVHAEPEHWAAVGVMALAIAAAGLIGSGVRPGWRLPAWFAVVASLGYGAHSLAFPSATSAAGTLWAVASILWGAAYAVSIVRRRGVEPRRDPRKGVGAGVTTPSTSALLSRLPR